MSNIIKNVNVYVNDKSLNGSPFRSFYLDEDLLILGAPNSSGDLSRVPVFDDRDAVINGWTYVDYQTVFAPIADIPYSFSIV